MKYVALIYTDPARDEARTDDEHEADVARYVAFAREGRAAGKVVGGDELASVSSATCVRVRDGETVVTDGPYAETREQLGGYFLLECEELDEAVALAARIPGAAHGSIEVRPVYEEHRP
jgi:hypothetical protein